MCILPQSLSRSTGFLYFHVVAFCLMCASAGYAQKISATGYFVVSGTFSSTYQATTSPSVIYKGTYDQTRWNVSQDGISVVGSSGPGSARASYHVSYFWLNAGLARPGGEQWHRRVSESIDAYVLGPPGTPFSLTYSWSIKTSAENLSSPCSTGFTLAYFQGPQTASVVAPQVGLTPTESLSGARTITGFTQTQTATNPSDAGNVYSLASTFTNSSGIQTGDSGPTGCSPALFTGSATTDASFDIAINAAVPTPAPPPGPIVSTLNDQLRPLLPVYNELCAALLAQFSLPSGETQIPAVTLLPTCLVNIDLHKITNGAPDANYAVVDQPIVPDLSFSIDRGGITQDEANALNGLKANQLQAAAYSTAIVTSLQRSQAASLAGDSHWMHKQDDVRAQFAVQLGAILDAQPALLKSAKNALAAAGFGPFAITAADVSEFKASIVSNGPPASVLQRLTSLGASTSDLVFLQSYILGLDTSSFPKIFPEMLMDTRLLSALGRTSTALLTSRACAADVSSTIAVSRGPFKPGIGDKRVSETLMLTNRSSAELSGPISIVLDGLSGNAGLANSSGNTLCAAAANPGTVFINASLPGNTLAPGKSVTVLLQFDTTSPNPSILYGTRVLAGQGLR